jgi:hypothetical protein
MSDQSIQAIWIKRVKRGLMDAVKQAELNVTHNNRTFHSERIHAIHKVLVM